MTLRRWLLVLCLSSAALVTACASGSSCSDSAPLDCANGACCDANHPFQCGSRCWITPSVAADNACTASVVCKSGDATVCYADWSCGADAQCASAMGGSRGLAGPFATSSDCNTWGSQHLPTSQCYCR